MPERFGDPRFFEHRVGGGAVELMIGFRDLGI